MTVDGISNMHTRITHCDVLILSALLLAIRGSDALLAGTNRHGFDSVKRGLDPRSPAGFEPDAGDHGNCCARVQMAKNTLHSHKRPRTRTRTERDILVPHS